MPASARQSISCCATRIGQGKLDTARSRRSRQRQSGWIVLGMGKLGAQRAQLLLRHRPRSCSSIRWRRRSPMPLEADRAVLSRLTRRLVRILQDRTERRLCLPHRSRLRPDPGATPLAISDRGRAALLREPRPELGARRDDQGAAGGRRHRRGRAPSSPSCSPTSGANIWTIAAIADIHSIKRQIHAHQGPWRDRGRTATTSSSAAAASARSSSSCRPSS